MNIIKSPNPIHINGKFTIFLAGSIDMGEAEDWQQHVTNQLEDYACVLLNPRRDDWDPAWEQTIENENFVKQVKWELHGLESADYILLYLDPNTKAPISLLEFGLHAKTGKVKVVCPEGFWRRGNVQIVCAEYRIPLYDNLDRCIEDIKQLYLHDKVI